MEGPLQPQHAATAFDVIKPIAEIALATGFADQPHFSKVFKQVTGATPGRYRLDMAA